MPTEIRYASNVLRHDNHTVSAPLTKRTLSPPVNFILIINTDTSKDAQVSFTGNVPDTITLQPGGSVSIDVSQLREYWTKGSPAGASLEVIVGSEL